MEKKIYSILEKLGFRTYSTKVLLFFSIIFLIAFSITQTLFVAYQFFNEKNILETGLYNAAKIRASLIEKRLTKLKNTFATLNPQESNIKKLLKLPYITGVVYKGKKYGIVPYCDGLTKKNLDFIFCKNDRVIIVKVRPDFLVSVKQTYIDDILDPAKGMISVYNPVFHLGVYQNNGSGFICKFYKIKNSNIGLSGCISKIHLLKTILIKNLITGTVFFAIFLTVGYLFLRLTNKIILYPINVLKEKVLNAKIQGLDKVDFNMDIDIKDEFGKLALLLEEMRLSNLRYQHQMNLVMETTSKMISITNDIEKFTRYVINRLEDIFSYITGNVVYIEDYYETDRKIAVYSDKFKKNKIKEDFIKELIEKTEQNSSKLWNHKGRYVYVYRKKIDNVLELSYALVSRIEPSEKDLKYIDIILSHLVYSINLINLANYDGLTRLLNRRAVLKQAQKALEKCKSEEKPFSLIIVDLDDFKAINDTYGHIVGDKLLREIGKILREHFSKVGIIGRLGGEEFIVVLPGHPLEDAVILARTLQQELHDRDFSIEDYVINITASFGVASLNEHGSDLYELMRAADLSLYKAKREGKNQVIALDKNSIDMVFVKEFKGRKELENAISEDSIVPFFQSIHKAENKEILGFEVLARIKTDEGYIPAEKFIEDIIKFGLSDKLDLIVQQKALEKLSEIELGESKIFFNLSKIYIHDIRNVYRFIDMCHDHGIDTSNIVFEITEEEVITDFDTVNRVIRFAKDKNIQLALDDFGAGYTSFSYLSQFDVDYVKIDGSLIKRIHKNRDKQIILEGIIHICRKKNIKTIAEKVENSKDYITLRFLGVDYVQGYFLSSPTPDLQVLFSNRN